MTTTIKQAVVLTLNSGTVIIGIIEGEVDDGFVVHYPLEMEVMSDTNGASAASVTRYMPFSKDDITIVHKHGIETITLCNDRLSKIYAARVTAFQAMASPITDPDETVVFEDMEGSGDDEDDDSIPDLDEDTPKRTYH